MDADDDYFLGPPRPLVRPWVFALAVPVVLLLSAEVVGVLVALTFGKPRLPVGIALGLALGVALLVALRRLPKPPKALPPLRVTPTGLHLPRSLYSPRVEWVPYPAIRRLDLVQVGKRRSVVVSTERRLFAFPETAFVSPGEGERFVHAARAAIELHDTQLLQSLALQDQLATALQKVRPVATQVTLAVIGLAYAVTLALDGPTLPVLVRLGANAPALILGGQWFRLFTANLLHASWLHIYLNGLGLLTLGGGLERLFGTPRYLLLLLLSALGGSVASMLVGTHVAAVGISTALFGLIGAWAYAAWRLRSHLPVGFQRTRRWWVVQLVVNGGLSLLPFVDWAAHVGGFVTGVLVTAVLLARTTDLRAAVSPPVKVGAGVLVTAFLAAIVADARYATGPVDRSADLRRAVTDLPHVTPALLNSFAWEQAIDPKSDAAAIAAARTAIDRALLAEPSSFQYLDTSATIWHRQGRDDRAARQEEEALALERVAHPDCGACKERKEFEERLATFHEAERRR